MVKKDTNPDGVLEGCVRALTQACVYGIETHKVMTQVYARATPVPFDICRFFTGIVTSASSAGFTFGVYFSLYNHLGPENPMAGPIASTAVSFIKQPISNSIRLMQAGMAPNAFKAGRRILQAHGIRGLYSGYCVNLAEDMIEWDMRARLYDAMRQTAFTGPPELVGAFIGALSGMLSAWVTAPFDTIKTNMAVMASRNHSNQDFLHVTFSILKKGGLPMLYRGAHLRALSSGLKFAMFYSILEAAQKSR
jgi:Mitochondrial carrier protein